jgi:diguanylate cyclase (GGDEF)-like protein
VRAGAVAASVGFPRGGVPEADLAKLVADGGDSLTVAGVGACPAAVVPLDDDATGRLVVARVGDSEFSREELNLARGMSRVLTMTLRLMRVLGSERERAAENARLLASLQARERLLEQLSILQRCISDRTPLDKVFEAVVHGAEQLVPGDSVALRLLDPLDPTELLLAAAEGMSPELMRSVRRVPAHVGAAGRAVAEGRIVVVDDYQSTPAMISELGLVTALAVPLHEHGAAIGSLVVGSKTRRVFEEHEREMLAVYAEQASVALAAAKTADSIRQAFLDSLTGLANRALLLDRVELALARGQREQRPVTLLFLDLDGFKPVNDSLGHIAGDELLVEVAARLKARLAPDQIAARLGGDEFAVLLGDVEPPEAEVVAETIIAELAQPFALLGREVFVNASIGIASGLEEAEDLLRNADVAMYRAKRDGGGRYRVFEPKMRAAVSARLELEADLRRAIERDELVLHYQPIVELATARIEGVEALVRWEHPRRGLVTPPEFIPLAEESGLIVDLDRWVIGEACRQAARWQDRYGSLAPRWVSANLSGRHLFEGDLESDVAEALAQSGIPPSSLTLELTETVLVQDVDVAVERLSRLKRLGVRLGIDDFGTGYSSLRYVSRFPADFLKIAKTFVDEVQEPSGAALAQTIVTLGRNLGMDAIAEGIEEPAQLRQLELHGARYGQGYLFARPLRAERLEELLAGAAPVAA